jgi:putative DNA methylase
MENPNLSEQLMAVVCIREGKKGKVYIGADDLLEDFTPNYDEIMERIKEIEKENKITIPNEKMITEDSTTVAGRGFGITNWHEIFMTRQLYFLLVFTKHILLIHEKMIHCGVDSERAKAIITYMALALSRLANYGSKMCLWNYTGGRGVVHSFGRQALPMTWDFPESNPLNPIGANWIGGINSIIAVIPEVKNDLTAHTLRGSATEDYFENQLFDAIVTDPPYYDNINYSDLSDFFYIWLKKTIGRLYPEHFSSPLTPKKKEIIVANYRHGNSKIEARKFYEEQMRIAFNRANQKLKNFAPIVIVYAHKTTFGWATLVDSLRKSGFSVEEAWPLDTERPGGFKVDRAMLASSIFLIARKQVNRKTGCYESEVKTELSKIVHERVKSFWEMGITGADLVIASVGAGLRAFTRFARVEYANGEEVPAEHFLAEVETIVLETILKRLSKEVGANSGQFSLAGVDAATRFYILWRYTYKYSVLDAGEAIIFANGTHVELDGPNGLSSGAKALLEKKKGKYRLKDFSDRGSDKKLGLMLEDGQAAPMIDALHRTLWLMENRPGELPAFLQEAQPNREQMRLVAQALAGPALKGGELGDISPHAELSALAKLTANWKSVIEGAALTLEEKKEQKTGQRSLFK